MTSHEKTSCEVDAWWPSWAPRELARARCWTGPGHPRAPGGPPRQGRVRRVEKPWSFNVTKMGKTVVQKYWWQPDDVDMNQKCDNNSKTYESHIRIIYQNQNRLIVAAKLQQHHIKIISKAFPGFIVLFLFWSQPTGTSKNHIKMVSKKTHQTISKSYPKPYLPDPNHKQNYV